MSTVGGLAILAAFINFVVAVIFGSMWVVRMGGTPGTEAPNITTAGAACGFAVASGLCLVAAAVAESGAKRREPPANRTTGSGPGEGAG